MLPTLVRSTARGAADLEASTGEPFDELFRRWSVALYLSGFEPTRGQALDLYRSVDPWGRLGEWTLAGPRPVELDLDAGSHRSTTWSTAGTSTQYVLVGAGIKDVPPALSIAVTAPEAARLQVTAVPLPPDLGRIELDLKRESGLRSATASVAAAPRFRLSVRQTGGEPVRLEAVAWERLVPSADPHAAGFRHDGLDAPGIVRACGVSTLVPGREVVAHDLIVPPSAAGPIVVKVVGTDRRGRRVAGWAELPPSAPVTHAAADAP